MLRPRQVSLETLIDLYEELQELKWRVVELELHNEEVKREQALDIYPEAKPRNSA